MSTSHEEKVRVGVTISDCARLWATLTTEYIPALRLELRTVTTPNGDSYLSVEVVDDSLESLDGQQLVNIWASREYRNALYLISIAQLFDLLIAAHRQIEAFFGNGSPFAPVRRRK